MEHQEDKNNCIFFAKIGDLESLKGVINQGIRPSNKVFVEAARGQNLEVCKYLQTVIPSSIGLRFAGLYGCAYGNIEMLKWALSEGVKIDKFFKSIISRNNQLEALKFLESKGMELTEEMIKSAVYTGSLDVLLYLLDSECKIPEKLIILKRSPNYIQMLKIFHERNVPGRYQNRCKRGRCVVCKNEKIWNEWEMETNEYKNYIQHLPRELVEDLSELLYV